MFWQYGNAQAGIDFYNECKKKGIKRIIAYDYFDTVVEKIDYDKKPDYIDCGAGI